MHAEYLDLALASGFVMLQKDDRGPFREMLARPELANEPRHVGFHGRFNYLSTMSGLHQAIGELDETLAYSKRLVELFDEFPRQKSFRYKYYLQALNNTLNQLLVKGDFASFDALATEFNEMLEVLPDDTVTRERRAYFLSRMLQRLMVEHRHDEALAMLPEFEANMAEFRSQPGIHIMSIYLVALTRFHAGQYERAQESVVRLLDDPQLDADGGSDYRTWAFILNLLIHYELGNRDYLEYARRSLTRHLRARKHDFELERTLLRFLGKLAKTPQGEERDLFDGLRVRLREEKASRQGFVSLYFLDLEAWIDRHLRRLDGAPAGDP